MVILYVLLEIRPNREISPQAEIPDQTLKGWFSGKGWNYGLQEVAGIKAGKIGRETEKSGVFEEVTKGSPNSNHCCFCFQVCTLVGRLSAAPGSYLANKSLYLCPVQFLACPHLQNTETVSSPCSWLGQDGSQWQLVHCHRMQRLWQRQRKGDASRSQMCCTRGAWESLRCESRFFIILVSSIGIFTKDYGLRCLPLAFQLARSLP